MGTATIVMLENRTHKIEMFSKMIKEHIPNRRDLFEVRHWIPQILFVDKSFVIDMVWCLAKKRWTFLTLPVFSAWVVVFVKSWQCFIADVGLPICHVHIRLFFQWRTPHAQWCWYSFRILISDLVFWLAELFLHMNPHVSLVPREVVHSFSQVRPGGQAKFITPAWFATKCLLFWFFCWKWHNWHFLNQGLYVWCTRFCFFMLLIAHEKHEGWLSWHSAIWLPGRIRIRNQQMSGSDPVRTDKGEDIWGWTDFSPRLAKRQEKCVWRAIFTPRPFLFLWTTSQKF